MQILQNQVSIMHTEKIASRWSIWPTQCNSADAKYYDYDEGRQEYHPTCQRRIHAQVHLDPPGAIQVPRFENCE